MKIAEVNLEKLPTLNVEKLLELYAGDPESCQLILDAENMEKEFADGMLLVNDTVRLRATLSDETGCWEMSLEAEHGKIVYVSLDYQSYKINIRTIPNVEFLMNSKGLSKSEAEAFQQEHSRTLDIDLKDLVTLKKAKEHFKGDYILNNITLDNPTMDQADRLLIWHIRAYRKFYFDYFNSACYLWDGTGFKNASSLAKAMRERGLVK